MKKITIKQIMKWNPCYTESELVEIFKSNGFTRSATPLEIAKCNNKKKEDILWLLLRPEIIPEKELHLLSIKFAERALMRERKEGREPHTGSWNAIKVKKKWLKGEATDTELEAAELSAWTASCSAARSIVQPSKSAAANSAAWAAQLSAQLSAWPASCSSARSAELAAGLLAAWAALSEERNWQLKQVVKVLEKIEKERSEV